MGVGVDENGRFFTFRIFSCRCRWKHILQFCSGLRSPTLYGCGLAALFFPSSEQPVRSRRLIPPRGWAGEKLLFEIDKNGRDLGLGFGDKNGRDFGLGRGCLCHIRNGLVHCPGVTLESDQLVWLGLACAS